MVVSDGGKTQASILIEASSPGSGLNSCPGLAKSGPQRLLQGFHQFPCSIRVQIAASRYSQSMNQNKRSPFPQATQGLTSKVVFRASALTQRLTALSKSFRHGETNDRELWALAQRLFDDCQSLIHELDTWRLGSYWETQRLDLIEVVETVMDLTENVDVVEYALMLTTASELQRILSCVEYALETQSLCVIVA